MLLERPGELVSREDLRGRLWPGNRVVEFEQGLNAVIDRLREALGDSADHPKYIETLPRRGYRFIGSLAAAPDSALPATPVEAPAATSPEPRLAAVARHSTGGRSRHSGGRTGHHAGRAALAATRGDRRARSGRRR